MYGHLLQLVMRTAVCQQMRYDISLSAWLSSQYASSSLSRSIGARHKGIAQFVWAKTRQWSIGRAVKSIHKRKTRVPSNYRNQQLQGSTLYKPSYIIPSLRIFIYRDWETSGIKLKRICEWQRQVNCYRLDAQSGIWNCSLPSDISKQNI